MQFLFEKRYQILETLGKGSMSIVHLALDKKTNQKVAVKEFKTIELSELEEFVVRFKKEAEIISKLHHPNIIQVYNLIREKDYFYLIMEYFQGKNLKQSLEDFTFIQKIQIMRDLADTLSYIHAKDIVHRDLKPENILIHKNGKINLKIIDFGLANLMDIHDSFRKGTLVGTLSYISPEQTGILW